MQGVRTTQGCINCRRRKKGCDFQTPVCGRCRRLNERCHYEERRYRFVDAAVGVANNDGAGSSRVLTSSMHRSLATTEGALKTDFEFWSAYLPVEDPSLDGKIGGVLSAPWIPAVRALAQEKNNVQEAVQACSYAGLGWMRGDPSLVQYATHLYAKVLREINTLLKNPLAVCGDDVLACCRIFSLFELFGRGPALSGGSRASHWSDHVNGTCQIVQLRGPQRHASGRGLQLYDGVRMTAVIHGLARRQPNGFTTLGWHLHSRNLRDELFELILPAPALLQRIDELSARVTQWANDEDRTDILDRCQELFQDCLHISDNLRRWELKALNLCEEHESTLKPGIEKTTAGGTSAVSSLFDVCTSYGNGFFFICTQYWAMCTTLFRSFQVFYAGFSPFVAQLASPESHISQFPQWVDPEPCAMNISKVASHFFRPEAGLWSAQSAVFPIGVALSYFAGTGRSDSHAFKVTTQAFIDKKAGAPLRDFLDRFIGTRGAH